jgi:phosphoserine phosphatase
MLFAVGQLGLRLEVSAFRESDSHAPAQESEANSSLCVTLLGELTSGAALAQVTRFLADQRLNIREIRTLSEEDFSALELRVDRLGSNGLNGKLNNDELCLLRGQILKLARTLDVDIAVQRDDIYRRNKRLVCIDVDSTFVAIEVIDELARIAGCGDRVAAVTERAMRGELDFESALRERVRLLKGLEFAKAQALLEKIPLTPGAQNLVSTLKALGFTVGLVSGGFDFFVDELKQRFQLDFAFSNQLEVNEGVLTGELKGRIIDAQGKAQALCDMAQLYRCKLEQTVGVGDGANDLLMLQKAGLGIAFRAKPKVQAVADLSLNQNRLDSLLLLMGLHMREIRQLHS